MQFCDGSQGFYATQAAYSAVIRSANEQIVDNLLARNGVQSHRQFIEVYQLGFSLLSDERKEMTEKYGVIYEEDDMGQMVKRVRRSTYLIDKTGMIRAVWDNIEDFREHPREVWDFIQKEKV